MPESSHRHDPKIAVLSVVAAVVFWLMNALNKSGYSTRVAYPLRIAYNDSLYIPTSPLPQRIEANLSGNGWQLLWTGFSFANRPLVYPITAPLATRFINTESLTARLADQLHSVKVNYVLADTLDVAFERRGIKTVIIRVDSVHIRVVRPFVVASVINVVPSQVQFEGPESALRSLPDTLMLQIPASRVLSDYDETLSIPYPRDPRVRASADRVSISFEVAELLSPLP